MDNKFKNLWLIPYNWILFAYAMLSAVKFSLIYRNTCSGFRFEINILYKYLYNITKPNSSVVKEEWVKRIVQMKIMFDLWNLRKTFYRL